MVWVCFLKTQTFLLIRSPPPSFSSPATLPSFSSGSQCPGTRNGTIPKLLSSLQPCCTHLLRALPVRAQRPSRGWRHGAPSCHSTTRLDGSRHYSSDPLHDILPHRKAIQWSRPQYSNEGMFAKKGDLAVYCDGTCDATWKHATSYCETAAAFAGVLVFAPEPA